MLKWNAKLLVVILVLMAAMPALAGEKQKGAATLKDFQPAGVPGKDHKHQQFDFIFDATGTEYTCRSNKKEELKAIDFPVGSEITFEIEKEKGKVRNSTKKEAKCTIVRVEAQKANAPK